MNMQWIAQIFGILAMVALFSVYQQEERKKLLRSKLMADVCWVIHYLCLGAVGGLIPNFVGIFRELVFINRDKKKWASANFWPVLFIAINWGLAFAGTKDLLDYMPVCASTFVTISLWLRKPKLTKIILAPVCMTFLIYDVFVGSWAGVLNESISLVSIAISFVKGMRKKEET